MLSFRASDAGRKLFIWGQVQNIYRVKCVEAKEHNHGALLHFFFIRAGDFWPEGSSSEKNLQEER